MPATNPSSGQKAIFQINNTTYQTVTGIKTCDLQIQETMYDVTDLNNNSWKLKLPGLAEYSLKIGGNWDMSDAQQAVLQADIITTPGTLVSWKVYPKGVAAGTLYSGTGYIKTQGLKFDVAAEESMTIDIDGSGAIVFTP